jgi:hypothetical protein
MHETDFVEFHMSDFVDSKSRPCAFESGPEWPFFAGAIGKSHGYVFRPDSKDFFIFKTCNFSLHVNG